MPKNCFPLSGIFCAERNFLLFIDQLAGSRYRKTKEIIILRRKRPEVRSNVNFKPDSKLSALNRKIDAISRP